MGRVTIKDVARHSGYSFKTVARVVNGVSNVDPKIQEKVKASITELGYEPNVAARNLRGRKSFVLGLVYENPVADIQKGVLSACRSAGFALQILPFEANDPDLAKALTDETQSSRLAGLILPPPFSESVKLLRYLKEHNVPVSRIISARGAPNEPGPCVYVDDFAAAYSICEHLIGLGHRDIAFIWGDPTHGSSCERFAGYSKALSDHGISPNSDWIVPGEYTFQSGRSAGQALLALEHRPSAIVASNDEIAAGALVAARMSGLAVPGDLAIAGFENSRFSEQSWPPITTAAQPTEEIARSATELLIRAIAHGAKSDRPLARGFVPQLVVRDSTATPQPLPEVRQR